MTRPGRDAPPNMTDYDAERASFRLDVPARFNFVADVLGGRAARQPDDLALLSLDANGAVTARHTYAELLAGANRMANALLRLGIRKGDPIFLMLPRIPEWYIAVLGAIRIGAVPMPGTPLLTSKDIAYRIAQAGAVAAITDGEGAAKADASGAELTHRICVGEMPFSVTNTGTPASDAPFRTVTKLEGTTS
jgi:acyl-coenzyme A synthetase/AMP-(fatty) acid ligase